MPPSAMTWYMDQARMHRYCSLTPFCSEEDDSEQADVSFPLYLGGVYSPSSSPTLNPNFRNTRIASEDVKPDLISSGTTA